MKIKILGNNSALPAYGRYPTCQVVEIDGTFILVDCGEGAQILLQKHRISHNKIQHIFISHLHGDHYFGLPGLINSMSLLGRSQALYLYAPAGIMPLIQAILDAADTKLSYPLHFKALAEQPETLFDNQNIRLKTFLVEHRIFCCGLLITEKSKGRKLLSEQCRRYEVPAAFYKKLKQGEDYERKDGFLVRNEWVTEKGKVDKIYAYCADTRYTESFLEDIKGAQVIYHESTYLETDRQRAIDRYHSTSLDAARIAIKAGAEKLILGHYSSKYKDIEPFEEEGRSIFEATFASREGDEFSL